ncbi:poly-gamma-glutamate synthase PgsB [Bacteroidota bacterium]
MEILLLFFTLFIIFLIIENILYSKKLNKLELRITVSGTRGKTSIVRTLASVFRENNIKVLAKTTGSEAKYILPDGKEEFIHRRGLTNILEQKKLINKAIKLNASCVLTEIMSIHPENHYTETNKLIKPHLTILSNIRSDHTDIAESSLQEISEIFINDIYPSSKILISENEINSFIIDGISEKKAELIEYNKIIDNKLELPSGVYNSHISDNLDLVFSASKHFGFDNNTIQKGIIKTRLDIGKLEIYKYNKENKNVYFVNSFAANDPESTTQLMKKTNSILNLNSYKNIALMSLRSDRGERSKQWLEYLRKNNRKIFEYMYITGGHSYVLKRNIQNSEIIKNINPELITDYIISKSENNSIIFGLANIKGIGISLVNHWKKEGSII